MAAAGASSPAILLIDRSDLASRLLTTHLEAAGFRPTWVKTAREALGRISEIAPQLVLLELDAPEVDGFAMLSRLRAVPSTAGAPIMVIAARPSIDDMQRALQLGASDYLIKPVDPAAVIERIDRRLGRPARSTRG